MLDLIAFPADAGFCTTLRLRRARFSGSDRYYAGDQLTIVSNGDRATIPVADYRSLTNREARRAFPRQATARSTASRSWWVHWRA